MRLAALLQVLSGRYDEKVDVSTLVALHELTMFVTGMGGMRQKSTNQDLEHWCDRLPPPFRQTPFYRKDGRTGVSSEITHELSQCAPVFCYVAGCCQVLQKVKNASFVWSL